MDDDGFTLVQPRKGGAAAAAAAVDADNDAAWRYGATNASASGADAGRRKRKHRGGSMLVPDFYRFQKQDAKLDRACNSEPACPAVTCVLVGLVIQLVQHRERSRVVSRLASTLAGLADLRARFDEDKERLRKLREQRRFGGVGGTGTGRLGGGGGAGGSGSKR